MTKLHKIFFFFILFIFLTTYNPKNVKPLLSSDYFGLFNIQNIEIINNNLITKEEINSQLQNLYGESIFFIRLDILESILLKNIYINTIEVKKKYPNTIKLKIFEERLIAISNRKKNKFFLTESSKLIPFSETAPFKDLPLVFGEGAEMYLPDFLQDLKRSEFPIERIKNFYFFKIGRWDIQLKNQQIIKLPFTNVSESINKSIQLLARDDFQKYKVIDLRINDKIITE